MHPAKGSKDLNTYEVQINNQILSNLSEVYKLWGYEEVLPPTIERISTLTAGGAISEVDIPKLVTNEPLGLRPEMTASIARTANTRFSDRPRPLRLWAAGHVFENKSSVEGGTLIEETLQSGVELFGINGISGEIELLSLLLESMQKLNIKQNLSPSLLIGHTSIMDSFLNRYNKENQRLIRKALVDYNRIEIENLQIDDVNKNRIISLHKCRGLPTKALTELRKVCGNLEELEELDRTFNMIEPIAERQQINLQFDPTFLPQYELYNGLVFQFIVNQSSPLILARGGRYEKIFERHSNRPGSSDGLGFTVFVDKIREINKENIKTKRKEMTLIAYPSSDLFEKARKVQISLHKKGEIAILELEPTTSRHEALRKVKSEGFSNLEWIE